MLTAAALLLVPGCSPSSAEDNNATAALPTSARNNPQLALAVQRSNEHLLLHRSELGLTSEHKFMARSAVLDPSVESHIRFDQTFRGVRIWNGEAIVRATVDGEPISIVSALVPDIDVSTAPSLTRDQALNIMRSELKARGPFAYEPKIELVIYPHTVTRERGSRLRGPDGELNALDLEDVVDGFSLAYHLHTELHNGAPETAHTDYLIDAHSGAVVKKWGTLFTAATVGVGNSQYSGTVQLGVDTTAAGFELRDTARAMNIVTYDMNHGTSGTGTIVMDADNTWGDGRNYNASNSTDSPNGQTAAVDAHYGAETTFDYYLNIHGRNGIDGNGLATYTRVHYSGHYDNMFWADTCFCLTIGDGSMFTTLTSIDMIGHEMTHGVTSRTAQLSYSGESGGLNEAMSDIFGTLIEFYARRGGTGSTIGDDTSATGGNYLLGEQLSGTPLRYMYKPSKDGASQDAWSSTLGSIDVHFSSGPMNRAFYFLARGASNVESSDLYSPYLPAGMTGIGNDKAARITYRALVAKLTANSKYAQARTAFLDAARELYGSPSTEYQAVADAFTAINVGTSTGDSSPPTTTLTVSGGSFFLMGRRTLNATATDDVGVTKVEFYVGSKLIGSDSSAPYSISWDTATVANGNRVLTSKAYDAAGNVGTSAALVVIILNPSSDSTPPTTALTAPASGATLIGTPTVSATATDNVGVTKVEYYAGAMLIGSASSAPYSISWNTESVASGSYSMTSKAYDAAGNVGTSAAIPVIVSRPGDSTAPTTTLTAPTSGSVISGTLLVSATAMDNVGVTKVEFYAGTTLLGSDTTAPYSVQWNTTPVANGAYSLISKAYDAAGNVGTSAAVSVLVRNGSGCGTTSQLLKNPGLESGATDWTATAGVIDNSNPTNQRSGAWVAWFGGHGLQSTDNMWQQVVIPEDACSANLSFWVAITTDELDPMPYDKLTVSLRDADGNVLDTLATYSNLDAGGYTQKLFDLSPYRGKTLRIHFKGVEDLQVATSFFVDDLALNVVR